jgi:hypothetical protein
MEQKASSCTTGWDWKTASYTAANNTCVETKADALSVRVRDTKDRAIPGIRVAPATWAQFIGMVR